MKSVHLTTEHQLFLASVNGFNERFNAVRTGDSVLRLCHPFWNESEISKSAQSLTDWDVPTSLIPFYGDWHTLICLAPNEGVIKLLDDAREVLFTWPSASVFEESLLHEAEKPGDTSGIIDSASWLDF